LSRLLPPPVNQVTHVIPGLYVPALETGQTS